MTPAAGGAGSSSEAPGRCRRTAQGEGVAAGTRPAALALQGSGVRNVYKPFTVGIHKQVCVFSFCGIFPALSCFAVVLTSNGSPYVTDVDQILSYLL